MKNNNILRITNNQKKGFTLRSLGKGGQARLTTPERSNGGQALITLLFFSVIAISIATAAIIVSVTSIISATKIESASYAFADAETGAEEAYLKLLRNPNYTGEALNLNNSSVTIVVTGENPKVITSTSVSNGFVRVVEVRLAYANGFFEEESWKEIF